MAITGHYKGQSWVMPIEKPTRRPVFKRSDGILWMSLLKNDINLPEYIEGVAKGWIKNHGFLNPVMQVLPGKDGYYYIGDKDKKPLGIRQPSAQK